MSLPTLWWQDFEITIRKNKRHELHRILLTNSVLWFAFLFFFFFIWMACERIFFVKLKSNLLSSQKRDCAFLTVENGPITWGQNIQKQYWLAKIKSRRVLGTVICAPRTIWNKPIKTQPQVTFISKVYRPNRHPLVWHTHKRKFFFL